MPAWSGTNRGEASSWDTFSSGFGEPGNPPDAAGSTGNAILLQRAPGGTVTGAGNIYNAAGPSRFEIVDAFPKPVRQIVLHVETSGAELDYPSVELRSAALQEPLPAARRELSRIAGARGSIVLSRWVWELTGSNATNLSIAFQASGPHNGLTTARLDVLFEAEPIRLTRSESAFDRWNYPYNATPGTRPVASTFGSLEEGIALLRHANFIIGFTTSPEIPPGLPPDRYEILAARVTLTASANFSIQYDPTPDSDFSCLPESDERFIPDADPGRPLELFGTGFQNGFTASTWRETSPYAPEGGAPGAFPTATAAEGAQLDASAVRFLHPAELRPFAVGEISGLSPGSQVPENSPVSFQLDLSQPGVASYLQRALRDGTLFLTATSLHLAGREGRNFPEYYTRDSLAGDPPSLDLIVRLREPSGSRRLLSIHFDEGRPVLRFTGSTNRNYRIERTAALGAWQTVPDPVFTVPQPGVLEWKDSGADPRRFYRICELPN